MIDDMESGNQPRLAADRFTMNRGMYPDLLNDLFVIQTLSDFSPEGFVRMRSRLTLPANPLSATGIFLSI